MDGGVPDTFVEPLEPWVRATETEQVVDLADCNRSRNPGREPNDDQLRHEADETAEVQNAHQDQHDPGQHPHQGEGLRAVQDHDVQKQWHERRRWPGDVVLRAAQHARRRSGEHGRIEAGDGGHPDRHGQRDRQRERDDAHDQPREEVPGQFGPRKEPGTVDVWESHRKSGTLIADRFRTRG